MKADLKRLKDGTAGRRFRDFRTYKSGQLERRGATFKLLSIGLAIVLVMVGLAIGWLPGPGGFLSVVGIAMLIPFIPGLGTFMDRFEVAARRGLAKLRALWK